MSLLSPHPSCPLLPPLSPLSPPVPPVPKATLVLAGMHTPSPNLYIFIYIYVSGNFFSFGEEQSLQPTINFYIPSKRIPELRVHPPAPGVVTGSVSPCVPPQPVTAGPDPSAPVPPQGLTVPTEHTGDGANSPSRNRTHHFPLMKTRFTPTTIIPLFLDTGPCLREALLLFLLKKKRTHTLYF